MCDYNGSVSVSWGVIHQEALRWGAEIKAPTQGAIYVPFSSWRHAGT